jgi:hypothetical protein
MLDGRSVLGSEKDRIPPKSGWRGRVSLSETRWQLISNRAMFLLLSKSFVAESG